MTPEINSGALVTLATSGIQGFFTGHGREIRLQFFGEGADLLNWNSGAIAIEGCDLEPADAGLSDEAALYAEMTKKIWESLSTVGGISELNGTNRAAVIDLPPKRIRLREQGTLAAGKYLKGRVIVKL